MLVILCIISLFNRKTRPSNKCLKDTYMESHLQDDQTVRLCDAQTVGYYCFESLGRFTEYLDIVRDQLRNEGALLQHLGL